MTSQVTPKKSNRNADTTRPPPDGADQPTLLEQKSSYHHKRASLTLRQVQRVSKRAALASKRKIWDSNDASIDAAQTAVDHWENMYTALRGLMVASAQSAHRLYGAAKTGANGLEHGLLVPVRDWILLPTFWGVERVAGETVCFLQSPQAAEVANASLDVVRSVPFVGENVLAPALVTGVDLAKTAWHVAQYPIPSKAAVRDSVDFVMTGTKWALTTAGREMYFYAKIVDANITRTLMHTQWKVLGSGPYAGLDKIHKGEVIDHLCERYFSLVDVVHRYELAAYIRAHNPILYNDLVLTGLLRDRGGELTRNDEWLSRFPIYRLSEARFLLRKTDDDDADMHGDARVKPLWFTLRYQNGKRPGRDVPWVRLPEGEKIEQRYLSFLAEAQKDPVSDGDGAKKEGEEANGNLKDDVESDAEDFTSPYPTVAQWYKPQMERDILVDQKRHALSYLLCCPNCRGDYDDWRPPLAPTTFGSFCSYCKEADKNGKASIKNTFLPPPVKMKMRPTLWRFHGPGDEVRRAVWFLDTQRHGLQPYSEDSAAVLEDAYLFLKWKLSQRTQSEHNDLHGELLTIEVPSPNGAETQLVQFRSLTQVTAISKTLGGAVSLFKRRVYRGVADDIAPTEEEAPKDHNSVIHGEEFSLVQLDDALEVDVEASKHTGEVVAETSDDLDVTSSLAIPSSLVRGSRTDKSVCADDDEVDHLVLIVHGIGEMLRSIDLFGGFLPTLSSIVDCCRYLRTNHAQIHAVQSEEASRLKECSTGRVEYLPVEWHEAFALQSQRQPASDAPSSPPLKKESRVAGATMNDISLNTIPQMRAFANDTLLDVLYFMSPEHHDKMIDIVTSEMNLLVNKFRNLTGFNGRISVIGHSLGSVIAWDILANQVPATGVPETYEPPSLAMVSPASASTLSYNSFLQKPTAQKVEDDDISAQSPDSDSVAPDNSSDEHVNGQMSDYPQLQFEVQHAFMLGSPIAVFLMIRNQHKPLSENFYLSGCRRVFNIFHPYDPVAYRIEPLLDPRNADIGPRIITHWNGGFRVQYQTKLLWKKLIDETWKTQQNVINAVESRIAGLGLLDGANDVIFEDEEELSEISSDDNRLGYVNCGKLNQGHRIDYMLQEKEIENATEYVAALAAHSSYWNEKDFSLFVARQINRARSDETGGSSDASRPSAARAATVDL